MTAALVEHIHSSRKPADGGEGAVLVFLPGWSEIATVQLGLGGIVALHCRSSALYHIC